MSPNDHFKREKRGTLEFLVLCDENKQQWGYEAQAYLQQKGYWYTIDSTAAETAEEILNVAPRAAGVPAPDSFIKHCREAKAFMALFASEGKRGELSALPDQTPLGWWNACKGLDATPDLGAGSSQIKQLFGVDDTCTLAEFAVKARTLLKNLENIYSQRVVPVAPGQPYILIQELGALASLGFIEGKDGYEAFHVANSKSPLTSTFEPLVKDALTTESRIERANTGKANKAVAFVANVPQNSQSPKCVKGKCIGKHWSPFLKKMMSHAKSTCRANPLNEQPKVSAKALLVNGLNAARATLVVKGDLDELAAFDATAEEMNASFNYPEMKSTEEMKVFLASKPRRGESKSSFWERKNQVKLLLDTGANNTFVNFRMNGSIPTDMSIGTAAGDAKGIATGTIQILIDGEEKYVLEAIQVMGLSDNLVSVSKLTELGYEVTFGENGWVATHLNDKSKKLWGPKRDGLYILWADVATGKPIALMKKLRLFHESLGHASIGKLRELQSLVWFRD